MVLNLLKFNICLNLINRFLMNESFSFTFRFLSCNRVSESFKNISSEKTSISEILFSQRYFFSAKSLITFSKFLDFEKFDSSLNSHKFQYEKLFSSLIKSLNFLLLILTEESLFTQSRKSFLMSSE